MNVLEIIRSLPTDKTKVLENHQRQCLHRELLRIAKPSRRERLSGVYFLFDKDEVVYIGQSCNIISRVDRHRNFSAMEFDSYAYILMPEGDRLELEYQLIRSFRPKYCGEITGKPKTRLPDHIDRKTYQWPDGSGVRI